MKYTSTYKNVKNSKALDVYIKDTFDKFDAYFPREVTCYAVISKIEGNDLSKTVEITIRSGKQTFRAETTSDSFHKSVNETYDKIKKQIRRHKDKTVARKRGKRTDENVSEKISDDAEILTTEDEQEFVILKKKNINSKPISVAEAILQMESKGYTFLPFVNAENDTLTVVYKIGDNYGIIE